MAECSCQPGKREDGWLEERCEPCDLREFEQFKRMMDRWHQWREDMIRRDTDLM